MDGDENSGARSLEMRPGERQQGLGKAGRGRAKTSERKGVGGRLREALVFGGSRKSKVHSFLGVIAFLEHAPKKSSAAKMEGFL